MIKTAIEMFVAALPWHIIAFTLMLTFYLFAEMNVLLGITGYLGGALGSALVLGWIVNRHEKRNQNDF